MTIYRYCVEPGSELAALFEHGKMYTIRGKPGNNVVASGWYGDQSASTNLGPDSPEARIHLTMLRNHVSGRATFRVVSSVPWPPRLHVRLRKQDNDKDKESPILEVSTVNTGSEPISVKTRGEQYMLQPQGPLEPEAGWPLMDRRTRIIDAQASPLVSFEVIDIATNTIVRHAVRPGICALTDGTPRDRRPKLEHLVTLKPGEPVVRQVDVTQVLSRLPDGTYGLRLERRGMWWCVGSREDFEATGEDRVPQNLFETLIMPAMLECDDVVTVVKRTQNEDTT
ncbi:hypothetical protein B0I35DRAFT_423667 [Stachybotrys elegans]|uniref:Uncharacterized protein n=1 Tax=Stachybotrys elegans TaxID=80388 RepID=A0A8K0SVJ5_9HYPO|nr:hypothetical protein B0I35DRAFT_423667 [Stachybotrys elegans]